MDWPSPFSEKNNDIAHDWFTQPVAASDELLLPVKPLLAAWKRTGNELSHHEAGTLARLPSIGQHNTKPFWMWDTENRSPVIVKKPKTAIIADVLGFNFAYMLELPVPPTRVVVEPGSEGKQDKYFSASLMAFERCTAPHLEEVLADPYLRGMFVLNSWLYNYDGGVENAVRNADADGPPNIAYFDFSMVKFMKSDIGKNIARYHPADQFGRLVPPSDDSIARNAFTRITLFDNDILRERVDRLPDGLASPRKKANIVDFLAERRDNLREIVNASQHFNF